MSLQNLINNEVDEFKWAKEISLHFQDEENTRISVRIETFINTFHVTMTIMPSLHAKNIEINLLRFLNYLLHKKLNRFHCHLLDAFSRHQKDLGAADLHYLHLKNFEQDCYESKFFKFCGKYEELSITLKNLPMDLSTNYNAQIRHQEIFSNCSEYLKIEFFEKMKFSLPYSWVVYFITTLTNKDTILKFQKILTDRQKKEGLAQVKLTRKIYRLYGLVKNIKK